MRTGGLTGRLQANERKSGITLYDGFPVYKESLTNSKRQLTAISGLAPIQRQLIGTLVDTEAAIGYFLLRRYATLVWVAYMAAKMKYRGTLGRVAELIAHHPPSRSRCKNTITQSFDLRWSVQVQGVVAYTLIREVKPYLLNEKSIVEADCILKHGPAVPGNHPHPFIDCGGVKIRRGVWFWPQIDGRNSLESGSEGDADK